MLKVLFVLIVSITNLSAKEINLSAFKDSEMGIGDRVISFFKSSYVKSYKTQHLTYEIHLDSNFKDAETLVRDLEKLSQAKITYPKKTKHINLSPVVNFLYPAINLNSAPMLNSYNCHNTSLITQGFLKRQSYTSEEEIRFYMDNFCERVSRPSANTIGIYYHPILSHSFTVISKNFVFEKPSNSIDKPYRFLKLGQGNGFDYYQCNAKEYQKLNCPELSEKAKRLEELDKYFSKLANDLSESTSRSQEALKLDELQKELITSFHESSECQLLRDSYLERIYSLKSFYDDLQAGGIYGRGSYNSFQGKI